MTTTLGKKRIMILVVIGVVAVLALGIGLVVRHLQNSIVDKPGGERYEFSPEEFSLTQLSIVKSGDSLGCYYSWTATLGADGTLTVTVVSQPTHSDRQTTATATPGLAVLAELERVFDSVRMETWPDLPDSDIFACDAATTSVSFVYDGIAGSFTSNKDYPTGGGAALLELESIMESAVS